MLRFLSYDIVFQEVPNEVTLAINLSNCPNRCKGCHSPYLQEDKGDFLDENAMNALLAKYGAAITCICFMGGDAAPQDVERLSGFIKQSTNAQMKTAWYSGKAKLPDHFDTTFLDYLKLGPYVELLGGLDSPTTNQRFYCIEKGILTDETPLFQKKKSSMILAR
jgi:anaerobic ribonucleoside-triphosphate reductase activating protein